MQKALRALIITAAVAAALVLLLFITGSEKHRLTRKVREASASTFLELSEGWTEYEVAGPDDGDVVILIHGLSVPMFDWNPQFEVLANAGYRVIRYNQYGRALSDRPRGSYNASLYTRQLKDLMDSQGWDSASLVVHSMGAAVAVEFAAEYPDSVDRLVLISPAYHLAEDNGGIAIIRIPIVGGLTARTALAGILASRAERLFIRSGVADVEGYMAAFRNQTRYFGFSRSVKSLFRHGIVEELDDAYRSIPGNRSLLIWGTGDESIPEAHIERIQNLAPDMETVILEDVGHSPNLEVPEEVNALILDFLEQR